MNDLKIKPLNFKTNKKEITKKEIEEWKESHLGQVYALIDNFGRIKIGASLDPKKRITNIASAAGIVIQENYFSSKGINFFDIEKDLHKKFNHFRTVGEWFKNLNFKDIKKAINESLFIIPTDKEIIVEIIKSNKSLNSLASTLFPNIQKPIKKPQFKIKNIKSIPSTNIFNPFEFINEAIKAFEKEDI